MSEQPLAEKAHTARHQCGDCGRYVPEASVTAFRDDESGVVEATGTCGRCGVVDVFRVSNPPGQHPADHTPRAEQGGES